MTTPVDPGFPTWLPVAGPTALSSLLPAGGPQLRDLRRRLADGPLDPVTLELCRLRVETLVSGRLPASRTPAAVAAGLDEAWVDELARWTSSARFGDRHRAALRYTEQFVLDANGFTDDEAAAVREALSDEECTHLTMAVAVFDALARLRTVLTADGDGAAVLLDDLD